MQAPRIRRHTMLPNHLASQTTPLSMESGSSPPRRGPYPSPPNSNSDRASISGGVDIKKKPRAMSEMTSDAAGSMTCDTCGKGYKHASCLSKHKYLPIPPTPLPRILWWLTEIDGNTRRIGRRRQNSSFRNTNKFNFWRRRKFWCI